MRFRAKLFDLGCRYAIAGRALSGRSQIVWVELGARRKRQKPSVRTAVMMKEALRRSLTKACKPSISMIKARMR